MSLTEVLKGEAEHTYGVTEKLFKLVDAGKLSWKPETGSNWMTVGQLLMHCTNACGGGIKGFITGDWGLPEGMSFEDIPPDQMLPPAEKMPAVEGLEQALELLAEDKQTTLKHLAEVKEENLLTEKSAAPWGGPEVTLFQHLYHMIGHLEQHKGQLFYYLKLLGKDVNTSHLWGM
ncbi:MAG: DinB family protein [Acidobacteriota bacterium]